MVLIVASSFTIEPIDQIDFTSDQPQKKEQRIKVMVNKNGKTTQIDTTFTTFDEKKIQLIIDSVLKKVEMGGMDMKGKHIMIVNKGKAMKKDGHPDSMCVMVITGDSSKHINTHKVMKFDNGKSMIIMNEGGQGDFDFSVPPPPPPPGFNMIHKSMRDPFAFDPTDKSIESYNKKDLGKGREKITIIRKKSVEQTDQQDIQVKVITEDKK